MHLKFWRAYGACPRCGEQFSWRRGRHVKHCDDCGYEYWEAYYETIMPEFYGKESLDTLAKEAAGESWARRSTRWDNETLNKIWRALTEKRLGHGLPIMAKVGYGKQWKWTIHEEGKKVETAADTNATPCKHVHTETTNSRDEDWWFEACVDCGRILLHTSNPALGTAAEFEFFAKVIWHRGYRPSVEPQKSIKPET